MVWRADPSAAVVTAACTTSDETEGCVSGHGHWRPNSKSSHPGGARNAGLRVTKNVVFAPCTGAPKRYVLDDAALTVSPGVAYCLSTFSATLKFGGLNWATRNWPSISTPAADFARMT